MNFIHNDIVDTIGSIDDLIETYRNKNYNINHLIEEYCHKTCENISENTIIKTYVTEETERQKNNDYQLLSVVSSGEVVKQDDFFTKDTSSKDRAKYKIVYPYHFAFNPARANIGSIGMYNSDVIGCISPIYSVFKVKEKYELFFNYYLKSEYVKKEIIKKSSGSVRQNLPFGEFERINIPKISEDQINKLNGIIIPLWRLLNNNLKVINKLETLKNNYLNKFFK